MLVSIHGFFTPSGKPPFSRKSGDLGVFSLRYLKEFGLYGKEQGLENAH
jgi:hypothetical protein